MYMGIFLLIREMGKDLENFQGIQFKVLGKMPIVMVVWGSKILPQVLTKCKRRLFLLGFLLKCFRACLRIEKESDRGAL